MWRRQKLKSVLEKTSLASSLVQDGVLAQRPYDIQPWLFAPPLQNMRAKPGKDLPMPQKMDPALNATCRLITGCLRPTPTESLYILSVIATPEIRRNAASSRERHRQLTDARHPLFGHVPAKS